jgi:hypothetical protein
MTRARAALLLAVLAAAAVVATAALAVARHLGRDPAGPDRAAVQVVTDPATGATLEVPGDLWEVRGPRSRIYYTDDAGRPSAVVSGPAVFRDGYCAERPGDSNRGFAGFTQQSFDDWLDGLTDGRGAWTTGDSREQTVLADGTPATLHWTGLMGAEGACAATAIELAMVRAGGVRAVLVADSGDEGTLSHDEIVAILRTLRPPR